VQVYRATDRTPLTWSALRPVLPAIPFIGLLAAVVAPMTPTTILWLVAVTGLSATVYVAVVLVAFGLSETEVMIVRSAEERFGLEFAVVDWLIRRLSRR